ncbi:MAG: glycosyltransferase family 39 protein [Lachnospiraceae bacterium]|nr:glycosyltransferase family 39 protein [Lachnospiraceae bacterium]
MTKNIFAKKQLIKPDRSQLCLILIMCLATACRLIGLGAHPQGVLPDEAYGAYNAFGILTEGIDSWGYRFPVYYVAWGSGQSVLNSYLAIPFYLIFGVNIFAFRLPQALIGIWGVYAAYVIGRETISKRFGLLFAFVLAINPWHIMNTRYNLDANMAPGLFLIAFSFLVLMLKKNSVYAIWAAIFFGATLYCYVLSWIVVPLFLLAFAAFYWKQIPKNRYISIALGVLFVLALPLLLFVGVNVFGMPEIVTPYFSIPKLHGIRSAELSISHIGESCMALAELIFQQKDYAGYTSSHTTGGYYYFTAPLIMIGLLGHILLCVAPLMKKRKNTSLPAFVQRILAENTASSLLLMWTLSAGIMIVLNQNVTMIHANLIHIPMIFYGAYGIYLLAKLLQNRVLIPLALCFWVVSFGFFGHAYITEPSTYFFGIEIEETIEFAKDTAGPEGDVTILFYTTYKFSNLMWYEKFPVGEFSTQVVYDDNALSEWAEMRSFRNFHYVNSLEEVTHDSVYILPSTYKEAFVDKGFRVTDVNERYCVAAP